MFLFILDLSILTVLFPLAIAYSIRVFPRGFSHWLQGSPGCQRDGHDSLDSDASRRAQILEVYADSQFAVARTAHRSVSRLACVGLALTLVCVTGAAQSQAPPPATGQNPSSSSVKVGAPSETFPQSPVLPSSAETNAEPVTNDPNAAPAQGGAGKDSEIIVAPIPFSNQAFTWGLVPVVQYVFRINKNDTKSPRSTLTAAGILAEGFSWGIGGGTRLYLHEDRFRLAGFGAHGAVAYDLYGTGNNGGDSGQSVPIEQGGDLVFGEALVRVVSKLFVGGRYNYRKLKANLDLETTNVPLPPGLDPNDLGLTFTEYGPGFKVLYDTRSNQFYPTAGHETHFYVDFFSTNQAGNASVPEQQASYQSYQLAENFFYSLSPRNLLAARGMMCAVTGDPPFYDLCLFGIFGDLRGYEPGRYRDRRMFATQTEYRRILSRRWGFAIFAGVGEVAPSWDAFTTEELLPAGGGGIRFNLGQADRINLRLDLAYGKTGWSWAFSLGEAF